MQNPKTILITGGSSGIGRALALHYAAPGIFLALTGRNEERLAEVARECRSKGAEVETALINVTERTKLAQWLQACDSKNPFDLIIANAGISGGTGDAAGEPVEQARAIFDVNLTGVLNTIEPILPEMLKRGKGQIAVMSSLAAFRGWPGAPAYSASKGAVRFYGEAMRGALKNTGVEVNVICPGFVESRMTAVNKFPMPFLMPAEKAAVIIARGLAVNQGRIAFPLPTHFFAWLVSVLPDVLMQKILSRLPAKSGL